jgi:4-diphosphocytidyl-2-C-methyl-D-erythritol kinase
MEETAYAKLNLALHVRARELDGYHRIETLFAFAEEGDRLTVAPGEGLSLSVTGPFAAAVAGEGDNLVLRAAEALRRRCGVAEGAVLTLDKRLPVASGIGGGSADAAAALRLLNRFWGLGVGDPLLLQIAARLGSDVPACLRSETVRGEGRGDRLVLADRSSLRATPVLLVNPGVPVSTPAVFKAWDGIDRGALGDDPLVGRNDLEAAAAALAPEIFDLLGLLRAHSGVRLARMSGSGATCFALFESETDRDAADAAVAAAHPLWWRLPTRLR